MQNRHNTELLLICINICDYIDFYICLVIIDPNVGWNVIIFCHSEFLFSFKSALVSKTADHWLTIGCLRVRSSSSPAELQKLWSWWRNSPFLKTQRFSAGVMQADPCAPFLHTSRWANVCRYGTIKRLLSLISMFYRIMWKAWAVFYGHEWCLILSVMNPSSILYIHMSCNCEMSCWNRAQSLLTLCEQKDFVWSLYWQTLNMMVNWQSVTTDSHK